MKSASKNEQTRLYEPGAIRSSVLEISREIVNIFFFFYVSKVVISSSITAVPPAAGESFT